MFDLMGARARAFRLAVLAPVLAVSLTLAGSVRAAAIAGLENTGVAGANNPDGTNTSGLLADGQADPHYTSGFVATQQTLYAHGDRDPSTPGVDSQFINSIGNTAVNSPPGTYDYTNTFDLAGLDPSTAEISGWVAYDDTVEFILNNVSVGTLVLPGFGSLSPFTIPVGSPFVAGANSLTFRVVNTNQDIPINPSGLRVDGLRGSASVPEPASLWLLALAGAGLLRRCRGQRG